MIISAISNCKQNPDFGETIMERKYKILIIDDETNIRTLFKNYFTKQGFIVDTASNGFEGLNKLREDEFDVAIVDLKMPKMNGIEMINQALADNTDANMVMISNPEESDKKDVINALNIGVDAWFEKSEFEMPKLLKRVTELAQVISPDMVRSFSSIIPN
jgi:DNA-binding response OmpR family regulator